ncbi:MAG: bifunctional glutamate N-acetyltransferase/amino-acid acetyltransferase ArgJ [Sphingomonadaceae bacterium]|uniref:bifunctional glutamate N-acetyltransferase/amino-acid acetyltransferase ArgJ n=1 Tax=Thermaurantiacus sp. TaxID=2820283 RepID=UPI00298EFABF|nr:bifunctional glutamate N-acetyltransferase/amino-acid acetyltransferase ArgJ [Thermaurantiacus sp.]MCS6986417.1 bifunctional glutamate N-acetyltransferase/amino-acid acetyltransferase ArgJ [Sphingomonadaceae bacterium]MDW8414322.1 bifunctional glutamate N-acetyltransferase/amino-acid acetyltransferase ArgJ [Thermaurantiacus sp.]
MTRPSPLARPFPSIPPVAGVRLGTARAGFKAWARDDLWLAEFAPGTAVAGLFTRSRCPSPEVESCRARLPGGRARALVVNAGNANAFTGAAGRAAHEAQVAEVARRLGCEAHEVFAASTGVIGVPLPAERAIEGVRAAAARLGEAGFHDAARAMMTTDTFPKGAVREVVVGQGRVRLAGIAKGSGMIAPDMATLLAFLFTDAAVAPAFLQELLQRAYATSFACITVDGDTSTSDTLLAFATGASGLPALGGWADPGADALAFALVDLSRELALMVVRDGEGARKLVEVRVTGAVSDASARRIAFTIANSPLVKTAVAGGDANWGRVVAAVGRAGEPADRDRLTIRFGGVTVARDGAVVPGYDEAPVARHLAGEEVLIEVDLGLGDGRALVWTCDLTEEYVRINADYRS